MPNFLTEIETSLEKGKKLNHKIRKAPKRGKNNTGLRDLAFFFQIKLFHDLRVKKKCS